MPGPSLHSVFGPKRAPGLDSRDIAERLVKCGPYIEAISRRKAGLDAVRGAVDLVVSACLATPSVNECNLTDST
jgi:hypothetical protein